MIITPSELKEYTEYGLGDDLGHNAATYFGVDKAYETPANYLTHIAKAWRKGRARQMEYGRDFPDCDDLARQFRADLDWYAYQLQQRGHQDATEFAWPHMNYVRIGHAAILTVDENRNLYKVTPTGAQFFGDDHIVTLYEPGQPRVYRVNVF